MAIVSPEAAGRTLIAIVEVTLDTDKLDVRQRFERAISAAPEVMQGFYVTGNADFILLVTADSMQDYEAFAHQFFSKKLRVKYFRTRVVMRRVKTGFMIPMDGKTRLTAAPRRETTTDQLRGHKSKPVGS